MAMMLDTPGPFAPKSELQDFLAQFGPGNPDRNQPEVQQALREVRGYLRDRDRLVSSKAPTSPLRDKTQT